MIKALYYSNKLDVLRKSIAICARLQQNRAA